MVQTFLRSVGRDFRLPMSALETVARKSFDGKFTAKIDFPIGHSMLPLLMLTLEEYSLSIIWQVGLFGPHAGEIWTKSYGPNHTKFCAFWQKKWLTIFDKVLTPCWKTFLWLKQLFDAKILIQNYHYHLSVFHKLRLSDRCNWVRSCTKYGRPDQSQRKLTVALGAHNSRSSSCPCHKIYREETVGLFLSDYTFKITILV